MMDKYLFVENGVVVNSAVGEPLIEGPWLLASNYINGDLAGPGWTFDGTTFTAPPWQTITVENPPEENP
jgi:hypothetical protein